MAKNRPNSGPGPLAATPTASSPLDVPFVYKARNNLKPLGMAIQRALMRRDAGDPRTRAEKLGEKLVREALAGNAWAAAIVFDRVEGKVVALDDTGADSENQSVLLTKLVEALVDRKLGTKLIEGTGTTITDVVEEMVRRKE